MGTQWGDGKLPHYFHYSNEGLLLAQNRSLRFKSAVEMFPSPRVSM